MKTIQFGISVFILAMTHFFVSGRRKKEAPDDTNKEVFSIEFDNIVVNNVKISVCANYQTLLSQDPADGRAKSGGRWLTHISYSF